MNNQKRKKRVWGVRGIRETQTQRKNQQNIESIFEIDKLSRGGEGKGAVLASTETVDFLLAGKSDAGEGGGSWW